MSQSRRLCQQSIKKINYAKKIKNSHVRINDLQQFHLIQQNSSSNSIFELQISVIGILICSVKNKEMVAFIEYQFYCAAHNQLINQLHKSIKYYQNMHQGALIQSKGQQQITFKIIKLIGSGSQAHIYLVEDTSNQIKYALKHNQKYEGNEILVNEIFQRNQNLRNIIKIYYWWTDGDSHYQVLELGVNNLYTFYNQNVQTFKQNSDATLNAMIQISNGLAEAHQLNLIHRDMKPENIIIFMPTTPTGQIIYKIGDFGSSKKRLPNTLFQTHMVGTPMYMAPEMIKTQENYNESVDIWSFGCIWYFLVAGYDLFQSNNLESLIGSIESSKQYDIDLKIDKLENLDQSQKTLMKKLISIEPKNRPTANKCHEELNQIQIQRQQQFCQPKPPVILLKVSDKKPDSAVDSKPLPIPSIYPSQQQTPPVAQFSESISKLGDEKFKADILTKFDEFRQEQKQQTELIKQLKSSIEVLTEKQSQYEQKQEQTQEIRMNYSQLQQQYEKIQEENKNLQKENEELQRRLQQVQEANKEHIRDNNMIDQNPRFLSNMGLNEPYQNQKMNQTEGGVKVLTKQTSQHIQFEKLDLCQQIQRVTEIYAGIQNEYQSSTLLQQLMQALLSQTDANPKSSDLKEIIKDLYFQKEWKTHKFDESVCSNKCRICSDIKRRIQKLTDLTKKTK